jgi:hypothetical protein
VPSPVSGIIDELLPVMVRGDLAGFQRLLTRLHHEGRRMTPDQLTAAIGELAPLLAARCPKACSRGSRWSPARTPTAVTFAAPD